MKIKFNFKWNFRKISTRILVFGEGDNFRLGKIIANILGKSSIWENFSQNFGQIVDLGKIFLPVF